MKSVATTYKNPDTDGVSSAIGYAYLLARQKAGVQSVATFAGVLDPETKYALEVFSGHRYEMAENCLQAEEVYLVDTHHLAQIQGHIQPVAVKGIIDHHPGGNPQAFPQAEIQNEAVGAVATLVAERIRADKLECPAALAGLLYAGVISNTLGFKAPTTTPRDRAMADWLARVGKVPADFASELLARRGAGGPLSTTALAEKDCKIFEFGRRRAALSQLETNGVGVRDALARDDLSGALQTMQQAKQADAVLLNIIDVDAGSTHLVVPEEGLRRTAAVRFGVSFEGPVARAPRILLRKSEIVPLLKDYFDTKGES